MFYFIFCVVCCVFLLLIIPEIHKGNVNILIIWKYLCPSSRPHTCNNCQISASCSQIHCDFLFLNRFQVTRGCHCFILCLLGLTKLLILWIALHTSWEVQSVIHLSCWCFIGGEGAERPVKKQNNSSDPLFKFGLNCFICVHNSRALFLLLYLWRRKGFAKVF